MVELEQIVKELKARSALSTGGPHSASAEAEAPVTPETPSRAGPAPLFERTGRGSGLVAERESGAVPKPTTVDARLAEDGATTPPLRPERNAGREAERLSAVARSMADAAAPPPVLGGGEDAQPAAAIVMPKASKPFRNGSAAAAPASVPVPATTASGETGADAPGARPKRPGRRLFADTPKARKAGGGGGGAVPPNGSGSGDDPERRGMPFWLNGLGAVAAILLILLVGLWTYRLGQRDAMEVPIVRALEGPSRVAPVDPGGAQIAHQGLAVNEVLDGGGVASVAKVVRTAPGDEGAQPEDKAAGALVGLAEASKPNRRPGLSNVGANADAEVRAAVAIDDVLAMAHRKLADAEASAAADNDAAEREAIDAIVSAIAAKEAPQRRLPVIDDAAQAAADAVQSAERKAAEAEIAGMDELAAAVASPRLGDVLKGDVLTGDGPEGAEPIAGTGAAVSRPPEGTDTETAAEVVVTEATAPEAAQPVLVAAVALTPVPPAGEGSVFAPVRELQPRARPQGLAAEMRAAVDAAVGGEVTPAAPVAEPEAPQTQVAVAATDGQLATIPLPAGTRMIQLGAFDSEAVAEQQWARFSALHADLLGSKSHYVQRINSSGRVFYRLRVAGYDSKEATRAACSALSARGLPCISVTLR